LAEQRKKEQEDIAEMERQQRAKALQEKQEYRGQVLH